MTHNIGRIAWDCVVDLGITVVYATIAGLLIVCVAATDDGTASLLKAALYASLLPIAVMALIACDLVARVIDEQRTVRRRLVRVRARRAPTMTCEL